MSRRNRLIHKKEVKPDPIYNDKIVSYFINKLMWDGKKSLAGKIVYATLEKIKKGVSNEDPIVVFKQAIENCKPSLEIRSRRVGGATYQVPVDVRPVRKSALAVRWIIQHSRSRKGKTMVDLLYNEIMDAYNNRGSSIKKKEDMHKMAESNRAFSHYNW